MAHLKAPVADPTFVASTVQRSMPNPNRPRLSTATEDRFAECDRKSAIQYAKMETQTHLLNRLADEIDADADVSDNAVPDVEIKDDSLVNEVKELRASLSKV